MSSEYVFDDEGNQITLRQKAVLDPEWAGAEIEALAHRLKKRDQVEADRLQTAQQRALRAEAVINTIYKTIEADRLQTAQQRALRAEAVINTIYKTIKVKGL